jgi:radical SAM protein with 4Fe4S-binding SPASM domain
MIDRRPSGYDDDPVKLHRWRERADDPPAVAVWEITLRCDLACRHCGSRAGDARQDELDTNEALDVVRQLARLGVREVTLIGGEAYLRDDWHVIAEAVTAHGMLCTMVTGGRGLDDARLEHAARAGVDLIAVSIDGLPQTHDVQRGRGGSWAAAVDCARRIKAAGIKLGINTQINRLSMPELPAVAELVGDLRALNWLVQLTVAMGNAADRPELLLQPYHLLHLFPMLFRLNEEKLKPAGVQLFTGNNVGYYGPYAELLRYGGTRGHAWAGCGAGQWSLGLEADGKVKGCPSLPSSPFTGGNIRDRSIAEIMAAPELTSIPRRTRRDLWGRCAECIYADRCRGGCTWTAHVLFGRAGNNPYCHHRALALKAQGLRERVRRVRAAPGEPFDHGVYEIVEESTEQAAEDEDISPLPASLLAELFGVHAGTQSLWPKESLLRVVRRGGTSS